MICRTCTKFKAPCTCIFAIIRTSTSLSHQFACFTAVWTMRLPALEVPPPELHAHKHVWITISGVSYIEVQALGWDT